MKRGNFDFVSSNGIAFFLMAAIAAHCHGAPPSPGPRTVAVELSRYQQVVYVSAATGSDDAGNGSPAKPWQTIQLALSQIHDASAAKRFAVLVARGTYGKQTVTMKKYVDLFGGFRPDDWRRDIFQHATILDGESARRILVGVSQSRLDGFVVRGGLTRGRGAALLCDDASPTVTNNRFVENKTMKPRDWKPSQWHEIAHDGGAISCLRGAEPTITHNIFANNHTEVGRGAAIALHGRCAGEIIGNVFLDNETGAADEHRSSDGGAISVFDWSKPRIEGNILLGNRTLNSNDGGGIFVALWSSPVITSNIFVANRASDDGGALFIGGQEHRYDRPKDALPRQDEFCVEIARNVFYGNKNTPRNSSGGIRITMEARATIKNNMMAADSPLDIEASDVQVINNTIMASATFHAFSEKIAPRVVANNIFWGQLTFLSETPLIYSNTRDAFPGTGNFSADPRLRADRERLTTTLATYVPAEHITNMQMAEEKYSDNELAGRVVKVNDCWGIVKSKRANQISVWGDVSDAGQLIVMPTFELHSDSPCIDRGTNEHAPPHDMHGDHRPAGKGVDIGADEFTQNSRPVN